MGHIRAVLARARQERGWSQAELGRHAGLPQAHVSAIETGKVVPRLDTLLELARILEYDLLPVPRELVPAVEAMLREGRGGGAEAEEEQPLYTPDEEES